jgi:Right handed beta helix region
MKAAASATAQSAAGIAFVGSSKTGSTTQTIPPGVQNGDLLLAFYSYWSYATATPPTGWHLLSYATESGSGVEAVWYRFAGNDAPGSTYTWSFAGAKPYESGGMLVYRGVDSSALEDNYCTNQGRGTAPTLCSYTAADSGDTYVGFFAVENTNLNLPADLSARVLSQYSPGINFGVATADKTLGSAGTVAPETASMNSAGWATVAVALKALNSSTPSPTPTAGITYVGSSNTGGTSQTVPSTVQNGDLLLAFYSYWSYVTATAPTGWHLLNSATRNGSGVETVWYRFANNDVPGSTYVWSFGGAKPYEAGGTVAYRGVDPTALEDSYCTNQGWGNTPVLCSYATSHSGDLDVGFFSTENTGLVLPADLTSRVLNQYSPGINFGVAAADKILGSAGTVASETGSMNNAGWATIAVALKALSASTTAPAPTLVATPTPTVVATPVPVVIGTGSPTVVVTPTPQPTPTSAPVVSFYVSPSGNDGNNGMTAASAWRTVQHAATTMLAGDTAIVAQGTYNERVSITQSGITIQADPNAVTKPVVAQGFDIAANGVTVNGFEISFQNNVNPTGVGINVHDASNVIVENNYLHDLCHEGIFMTPTVSNVQVLNNQIVHPTTAGINIDGTGDLIQGNTISGTYQHPSALGGAFAGCTNDGGSNADADGMRFFGANHIVRSNKISGIEYDFNDTTKPNPNPHTDCFQTWGRSGENTTNILFERNWCSAPTNGSLGSQCDVAVIQALNGPVGNLTFQNNQFQDLIRGIDAALSGGGTPVGQLNIYNNTFDNLDEEAIVVSGGGSRTDNIDNNIFYDVGTQWDGFIAYSGGESFSANVFYRRAGAPGSGLWWGGSAVPPYQAVDPLFVNYGDSTGVGADYHLCIAGQNGCSATSTIGHTGATMPSVTNDYDGNSRNGGYSAGSEQMMH